MSELKFDIHVNSSEFIEKTEQIRSAIRATSSEIEEQEKRIGLSFQQMADKAGLTANVMGNAIKEMHKQISDAIISLNKLDSENQERLASLRNKMGEFSTKSEAGKTSDNGTCGDVLTQKGSVQPELNSRENLSVDTEDQQKKLAELNNELLTYQEELESAQNELSALRVEMTSVCEEMEQMRNAGEQNTEAYAKLKDKSIDLTDSMKETNEQLAKASDPNAGFEGVTSGLNGISGALSAATSMMELFSTESEFLQRVQQKVQTALAITNGLQEVNTALGKESAFQLNVVGKLKLWWRAITLQAASAQGIETTAASAGTVVNLGLAGSFRAIGLAIKSIPVIGWILAGISALIGVYSLWTSSTEEQKEAQDEQNKSLKEFNESIQNYAAKPVAMIELLSAKFKALGNDVDAQKKFVTDHKKAFDELGVSINNVKDAQQLLIDNKEKFIDAQIAKAMSLAYQDKMVEEAKKYLDSIQTATKGGLDKEGNVNRRIVDENTSFRVEASDNLRIAKRGIVDEGIPIQRGKKEESTVGKNVTPVRIGAQSASKQRVNNEKILPFISDFEARYQTELSDEARENMRFWAELSLEQSNMFENIMAELGQNKKTSNPKKTDNTKQIEEANEREMKLIAQKKLDRERFVEDSQNRITQTEIDALADGSKKTFMQLELNQKKERQSLEREKKELIRQRTAEEKAIFDAGEDLKIAKGEKKERGEFNASSVNVGDLKEEFESRTNNLDTKQLNERLAYYASERQAMEENLKDYETYAEKRQAIIDLGKNRKEGKSGDEKTVIDQETQKSLSDLDIKAAESSTAFEGLFSDVKERSVKGMRTIIDEAEKALDFIENGDWDADKGMEFGISKESFDALKDSSPEIDKIRENIEGLNEQADASDVSLNKMAIGFEHLFASGSDPEKLKKALGEIESSMNEVMQSTRFFSDCLSNLGDSFGSDTFSGIAEGMNVAMDAASGAMSGAQAGAMFGPWGAAAGAAIGLVSSLGSSLAKLHDAKNEKKIQAIQKQIEVLEKSYGNLGDSLDKAFSSDASELIAQQNTMLEQQKVLIQNQILEEKSKKKTDWGRIEEWENQIEDINKLIGENEEKMIDVFFGEDLKSAIDNFAQAYADAWNAGDDKAKTSKDLVKNMIKQMISEAIKAASSEPMEKLRKKLAGFFSDGIISGWEREQIEKDAEKMMKDLDSQFGWADEYMKGEEQESSSQDSTKGGFASMSQETGDELNGRFTALQVSNEEIKNSMLFVIGNLTCLCTATSDGNILLSEMRNLAIMSNGHLEDIAKHTKVLLGFGEKLDHIDYNTKSLTVK